MLPLHSEKITFDDLCKLLKVSSLDQFQELNIELSDEELDELIDKYKDAVENVARTLFEQHGMGLSEFKTKPWNYRIIAADWKYACSQLIETINGVGYFHFSSPDELKLSGPYATYRQAALQHIGWMKDYSAVYGVSNLERQIERLMRY